MADEANFAVRLINKATAPARAIRRAVGNVDRSLKNLRLRAMSASKGLGVAFVGATERAGSALKWLAEHNPIAALDRAVGFLLVKMLRLAKTAALVGVTLGVLATAGVTKGVAKAATFAESSRLAFTNLTGSALKGEQAFQRSIALSKELGLDVFETTKQYQKLLAAQFSVGEAENLIKLTTDLRAIGATAQETASAIRAITQIKAKGRLQAEELVGQLSEAGVATTLVYEALGKRLGKTQDEVRKLITAGKIDADLGVAAIQDAILKKANITKAGEAGKRFADATLGGLIGRLKAAPGIKLLEIAETSFASGRLKSIGGDILRAIESIDPRPVARFVEGVLDAVRFAMPLAGAFFGGLGDSFGALFDTIRAGGAPSAELKQRFADMGLAIGNVARAVADVLPLVMDLAGRALKFLASESAVTALKWTLIGLAFGKVAFAFLKSTALVFLLTKGLGLLGVRIGLMTATSVVSLFQFATATSVLGKGLALIKPLVTGLFLAIGGIAGKLFLGVKAIGLAIVGVGALPLAIAAAVVAAGVAIYVWWDDIVAFFWKSVAWFEDMGGKLIGGLVDGIMGAAGAVLAAVKSVVGGALEAVGLGGGSMRVETSAKQIVQQAPALRAAAEGRTGGRGIRDVSIGEINVNGGTTGRPRELAQNMARSLRSELQGVVDAPAGA